MRKVKLNFPEKDTISIHFKSVTHTQCPEYPKMIRAYTPICGYIIETVKGIDGKPGSMLHIVS